MRNHTSSYHATAALVRMEKDRKYKSNKINRANVTQNILILIYRLTKEKENSATNIGLLYGCIIYDYKTEGKKERKKKRKNEIQQLVTGIVPLKGHICTLFTPKQFHGCTLRYILVL